MVYARHQPPPAKEQIQDLCTAVRVAHFLLLIRVVEALLFIRDGGGFIGTLETGLKVGELLLGDVDLL